jgi:integrative and conjugative element protein (TIGR02256 family)
MSAEADERLRVELSHKALLKIEAEVARGGRVLETGGILLGHDSDGAPRVTVAGGPGPKALREPLRFSRDLDHAERLAEHAWLESQAVWLGEWHTHPGGSPVPSDIDMTSYGRHLADSDLAFSRLVSLIVALPTADSDVSEASGGHDGIAGQAIMVAWLVEPDGARIAQLDIFEETHDG